MSTLHVNASGQPGTTVARERKPESPLIIQSRVLHALVLRELKSRYGNRHLGFLWAFIEPLLFISIFVAGFELIGRTSQSGVAAPFFFVAGFSPFFMFRDIFSEVVGGTKGHQSLLMFPQVTRMDILISKLIFNAAVSAVVFIVLFVGLRGLGYEFKLDNILGVMICFALVVGLGFGTGLVIGALSIRYEFISSISNPLLGRPLFLTSGLFFSADMLPPTVRNLFLYNPLFHCIEYMRMSMFEVFDSRYVDLNYVCIFLLVQVSFGLMLLNNFERQRR